MYGRLSLITAHTQAQHAADAGADGEEDDGGMPAPEVVFEDAGDEEPDAEDPFAPEGHDDDDSLGDDDEDDEDGMDADSLGEEEDDEDDEV